MKIADILKVVPFAVVCAVALPVAATNVGIVELPASTNITVASGDTLRIEYLHGGTTLYKSGEGRLEVAVIGNTNLNIVVSNGTFATARPGTLDLSDDENVIFHLDANKASSLTTRVGDGGTNFVTGVADADGRVDRSLSTLSGRPDAYLVQNAINGLPAIDLGSLHNSAADGYGAALAFDVPVSGAHEMFYVFMDDPDAKNRAKSIGPCCYGSAGVSIHVRGYVEDGTSAPIHYTTIGGRAQDGNYIDGERYGSTGSLYQLKPVPDGPHVMRNKINLDTNGAFEDVAGLGYSSKSTVLSYGGLKIAEVIFHVNSGANNNSISARSSMIQTYLMYKWLGPIPTVGKVTLLGESVLDVSAAPLSAQIFHGGYTASVTGGTNLRPRGFYEAGNPMVAVAEPYTVPADQTQLPGLEFSGDASLCVTGATKAARIDGTGSLVKTGGGTLALGASGSGITSLDVRDGVLRIAPLEASGAYLHLDPAEGLTLSTVNTTNFVTKWADVENGVNYFQNTTVKYNFDTTRTVGKPYISTLTQNGLPLVDFGEYTTELYPSGNGSAFNLNASLAPTGANAPGMRNLFVVWGDYEGLKNLPYKDGNPLRGPVLFGAGSGWGYRGNGGNGDTFCLFNKDSNGTYNWGGNFKVDGTTVAIDHRPSDGIHLLDQRIYNEGAENKGAAVDYVGGCRWLPAYVGGSGSATSGVWGGLRMGEILIYRQLLPEYFRARVSAALRRKWFNVADTVSYSSVSVADGAALALPDTRLAANSLSIGGEIAAEQVASSAISVTADANIDGELSIPSGATVSFACGADGSVPELTADSVAANGTVTLGFAFSGGDLEQFVGTHRVVSGTSVSLSGVTFAKPVLPQSARSRGMTASIEARSDGIYCTFKISGLIITVE